MGTVGYNEMFPTGLGGPVGDRYRGEQDKSRGEHSPVGGYVTPVDTHVTPVGVTKSHMKQ